MTDARYFQDELAYLRALGTEYVKDHPELGRVLNEPGADPDVERLLEGFALSTSRLRQKLDDPLPELTQPILQLLWPNFLRPIPSLTQIAYEPIDRAFSERKLIPHGTTVRAQPAQGPYCDFLTTSDCVLYPLHIKKTRLESTVDRSFLRIDFATLSGMPLDSINLTDLRLWLNGTAAEALYQWSFHSLKSLLLVDEQGRKLSLSPPMLTPGGFRPSDSLLPDADPTYDGYRFLQEYFAYPQKFRCLDLDGLGPYFARMKSSTFALEFHYNRAMPPEISLADDTIRLYSTPAINLFSVQAETLPMPNDASSFRIRLPSQTGPVGIFAVDRVTRWQTGAEKRSAVKQEDFPRHDSPSALAPSRDIYFRETIHPIPSGIGYEHFLSFLSRDGRPAIPDQKPEVHIRCFNLSLENRIMPGVRCLQTQGGQPFAIPDILVEPTTPLYPRTGNDAWQLISNLSLNDTNLQNREALISILKSYDYRSAANRQNAREMEERMKAILDIQTKYLDMIFKGCVSRGIQSRITVRESLFGGEGSIYLFASVLAEFLCFYPSTLSFHQLEVYGKESGQTWSWKPRKGRAPLL